MADVIERSSDVRIQYPRISTSLESLVTLRDGIMATASRTKTIAVGFKGSLTPIETHTLWWINVTWAASQTQRDSTGILHQSCIDAVVARWTVWIPLSVEMEQS
jgi:hypothetical protein